MNYKFPVINTIDDVLPAIKNSPEFLVMDRGLFTVVNYVVVYEDTFPEVQDDLNNAIRRECRGLIFSRKDGRIMARRYHKFFNLNERDETQSDKINWDQPHIILEKLDGSMVSSVKLDNGRIVWTTKMGITEVASDASGWVSKHSNYNDFAEDAIRCGYTPIFEWCSRKSRVVVDFPEDKLYLTALRDNTTGEYLSWIKMVIWAEVFGVEVVSSLGYNDGKSFDVSKLEGKEGIVIRFDDGHCLKVKTEWYVLRHKSKELILREKSVLDLILNDKVDDVLPFLEEHDKVSLLKYRDDVLKNMGKYSVEVESLVSSLAKDAKFDKKVYALGKAKENNSLVNSLVYRFIEGGVDVQEVIFDYARKNISTREKIGLIRHFWNYLDWDKYK